MTHCIWTGRDTPRVVRDRHMETCLVDPQGPLRPNELSVGPPCRGCQPCTERHCIICGMRHVERQTCPECIGVVRDDLRAVRDLTAQLPQHAVNGGTGGRLEAARAIPGGEATVILAPGAESGSALPSDPIPTLLLLATWEDAWRHELGQPAAEHLAALDTAGDYLSEWLPTAAQSHPAFDEFASDMHRQVARLEAVLHDGIRHDPAGIDCFECGGGLVRLMTDEGMDDRWTCRRCRRRYTDPEYHLAVRAKLEDMRKPAC